MILSEIEGDLADPALTALSSNLGHRPSRSLWRNDHVLQAMAVLVIAIAILPTQWLFALVLIGVLVGPAMAMILTALHGTGPRSEDPPQPERDPGVT